MYLLVFLFFTCTHQHLFTPSPPHTAPQPGQLLPRPCSGVRTHQRLRRVPPLKHLHGVRVEGLRDVRGSVLVMVLSILFFGLVLTCVQVQRCVGLPAGVVE